jgi:hypothetical protein
MSMFPYVMHCDCQSIAYAVEGTPVAQAYCHCADCRDFYGATVLAATAWQPQSLTVTQGHKALKQHTHTHKKLTRFFCMNCGDVLFGTNRLGLFVVPNKQLFRSGDPDLESLKPNYHLFYRQRIVSIKDHLPKYLDGKNGETWSEKNHDLIRIV